jgi:hypothetical protein
MSRENRLTGGVFTGIVGTSEKISSYDKFLNQTVDMTKPHSEELVKHCNRYKDFISMMKTNFEKLAKLEGVIMQMRAKELISEEVKLSLVRDEYIYARTIFYREDRETKDIRIIVGKTEFYGNDLEKLSRDETFMNLAKDKLAKAIDKEIQRNLNDLNKYM